ncbi:Rho guanine nucleotide exchange factor, partial [Marasmius crinis-equi]
MDKQKAEALLKEVEIVLADEEEYKKLLEQRESSAQGLLDLLQALSVYPNVESRLRSRILKTLVRLSDRSSLFPKCLSIQNVETVGQYAVNGGAFGEIWKGRIGNQIQTVCLKIVRVYEKSDVEIVIREFLREAIIWRQLEHPNVLPFLGLYFMNDTRICLISPWMENGNLVQYLKAKTRAEVKHLLLVFDVANGLAHLHSRQVVHADLKGVNVLVTPGGQACLSDFGLAHIVESGEFWRITSSMSKTKGTTRWMAPELFNPSQPSYESDVYAFACVCYEIYTGLRPLHDIKNEAAAMLKIINGTRPLRPENTPELNDRIWSVMESCWTQEPSTRPTSKAVLQKIQEMSDCDLTTLTAPIDWRNKITASIWPNLQQQDVALETDEFISHSAHRVRQKLRPRLSLPTNAVEEVQTLLDGPGAAGLSMSLPIVPSLDAEELTTGVDTMLKSPYSPTGVDELGDEYDENYPDEVFVNASLLSYLAVQLRDKVPRGTHVKGSIPYPGAFTGKDIV